MVVVKFRTKEFYEKNLYCNEDALENVIHYVMLNYKTPHKIIGATGASFENEKLAIKHFQMVKDFYRNQKGKKVIHFCVSFERKGFLPLHEYIHVGYLIADNFFENHQVLFALHEDTNKDHIHFVVNTVNYQTGKKLRWHKGDRFKLQKYIESFTHKIIKNMGK